nr:helix-turn-helix domain-containing protein [Lachnospiraceae bacterium]
MSDKSYQQIIRELREDRDLSQTDVAKVLNTTQQMYSRYENGECELP